MVLKIKVTQGADDFISEFYQTFQELTQILFKLFQKKIKEDGRFNSFYEASTVLILIQHIPQQKTSKLNSTVCQKDQML